MDILELTLSQAEKLKQALTIKNFKNPKFIHLKKLITLKQHNSIIQKSSTLNTLVCISICILIYTFSSCKNQTEIPPTIEPPIEALPAGASIIPFTEQRSGDAAKGYDYLIHGDYVSAGIPLATFNFVFGNNSPDDLGRTGDNQGIPYNYTAITASNGAKVAVVNCLNCHAETLNGALLVGLGNNTDDYTNNPADNFNTLDLAVKFQYGQNSPEWDAYYPASRAGKIVGPNIRLATRGPNPADKIFATLAAYRDKDNLTWLDTPQFAIPIEAVPTDVPAWWLTKKKYALYYNGLGRGDFGRLSMASGLLTMKDSSEARVIDEKFADVMAYIKSIKAPAYPFPIDDVLAAEGKLLFSANCQKCHGTYGSSPTYPNYLIEAAVVGTDPVLAETYQRYPAYHGWFNDSWFAKDHNAGRLEPTSGYIAPPLDGIWATAPYLHNASVPTLEDVLHSTQRPSIWKRTFDNADYDQTKVGWNYAVMTSKNDIDTYDTNQPGYGNMGHTYGDKFSATERKALLEYLKTL